MKVRRCRFIASVPPTAGADGDTGAARVLGVILVPSPTNRELDCERGRVVEDASLGKVEAPFREVLGVPEARFLDVAMSIHQSAIEKYRHTSS